MKTATFTENKLATTVGANDLAPEIVVTQPAFKIRVNEEVEYEFDQKKFEEYLSSSSSRSASPNRRKKTSASKNVRGTSNSKNQEPSAAFAPRNVPMLLSVVKTANPALPSTSKAMDDATPILSKRALQRRRQRLAQQLAKARESKDGVRYAEDLKSRQRQEQRQAINLPSKTEASEWIRVKRNRSTLEERIKKRRALLAHARLLLKKAEEMQQETAVKAPTTSKRVWVPKSKPTLPAKKGETIAQNSSKSGHVSTIPAPSTAPSKKGDHSRSQVPLTGHLGPLPANRGRVPVKERLGPLKGPQVSNQTGGRFNPPNKENKGKAPITDRIGLRVELKEPVQFIRSQKRKIERATLDKTNQVLHSQGEAHSSEDESVILRDTHQHSVGCSSYQADELYYRAGGVGKSRKRYV